jgi:hypothetical protein
MHLFLPSYVGKYTQGGVTVKQGKITVKALLAKLGTNVYWL